VNATTSPGVRTTRGVVLAGSGNFANMRGTFVSTQTKNGSNTTVTLQAD
jgi:hypothetical protein